MSAIAVAPVTRLATSTAAQHRVIVWPMSRSVGIEMWKTMYELMTAAIIVAGYGRIKVPTAVTLTFPWLFG
jgi:hypothetical protein